MMTEKAMRCVKALRICHSNEDCRDCEFMESDRSEKSCVNILFEDAADLIESLSEQLEAAAPKWISVEERLPERHGQACVGLYSQHGDDKPYPFPYVFTWHAYGDNGYVNGPHFSDEGLDGLKVHYWSPLPEPPEVET